MILPDKYINIRDSIYGTSALILKIIGNNSLSISSLWKKCKKYYNLPYTKFMNCIIFMFITSMINYNQEKGEIYNENIKLENIK